MYIMFLPILFTIISTGMMSYLTMTTELCSWIAPMFVVVCMALIMPFVDFMWFKKYAIITIISSSVGGMIGICVGIAFPSFYFLHKNLFMYWISHPLILLIIISGFVISAGIFAFIIAFYMKEMILDRSSSRFPMAQLVYEVLFLEEKKQQSKILMVSGLLFSMLWNIFIALGNISRLFFLAEMNMVPFLMSVGFVAGTVLAPAILIGLATRIFFIDIFHRYIIVTMSTHMFLTAFASGMLIAWFFHFLHKMRFFNALKCFFNFKWLTKNIFYKSMYGYLFATIIVVLFFLSLWSIPLFDQWYVVIVLCVLAWYVGLIIAEVGIIDVYSYVWFVLLPLIYFAKLSSLSIIAIAIFATLFLGLVVDALFSYKLVQLAHIKLDLIFRYQIIACIISAFAISLFFLLYGHYMDLTLLHSFFAKVKDLDAIIEFGTFDYRVVAMGFLYGLLLRFLISDILVVIGAVIMMPYVSVMLIVFGALAHFIKNREKYYPIWFGVYAGHALFLTLRAFWGV